MASLDDLPVEVRLQILAHLTTRIGAWFRLGTGAEYAGNWTPGTCLVTRLVQSLLWIRLICRRWNDFFVANTSAVHRNAAAREGFVDPLETPLAQAVADARYINIT
ncbi:hypothetical protein ACG7TL_008795 [Trametes sanguinea]